MKLSKTLLALTAALGLSSAAHSAFIVNVTEVGGDVLFEGSGSINTTDLNLFGVSMADAGLAPNDGIIITGALPEVDVNLYTFANTGPNNFGSGGATLFDSGAGDRVGIITDNLGGLLVVPENYVSGSALAFTNQVNSSDFATLGMTPGTYTWTWGSGANEDFFQLNIGPVTVPNPLPLALLATGGLIGLSLRKKLKA